MGTMKEAIVKPDLTVDVQDSPIPEPSDDQVLIKVMVSGSNPKDWKYVKATNKAMNSGDDIAGIVHAVGKNVLAFHKGDRVAAFHEMGAPGGSFAEYALAQEHTTFHIPSNISFEEAATIPLAYLTAALTMFQDVGISDPWSSTQAKKDMQKFAFLIYGASTATGAFAAQLARLRGLSPIIGVAGNSQDLANKYCDYVIDYRKGEDFVVTAIGEALKNERAPPEIGYAFDSISGRGSYKAIGRVIDPNQGKVTVLLPSASSKSALASEDAYEYSDGVELVQTNVGQCHTDSKDLAYVWSRMATRLLADGRLRSHPFEVVWGGLNGIEEGMQDLFNNKNSGVKYVFKIA